MNFLSLEVINNILLGAIILLAVIIFFLIFHFFIKKKDISETLSDINNKFNDIDNFEQIKLKNSKKKKKNAPVEHEDPNVYPARVLLDFDRICNDMIIRDDGSLYSMVIQCRGINLDLMSDEEKAVIERKFIDLLNNVTFPFQLHIQTRVLDFNTSISLYAQREKHFESELKSLVDKFNQLQLNQTENRREIKETARNILSKQKLYEYSKDLYRHVEKISHNSFVIQNSYYVCISCSSSELGLQSNSINQNYMDPAPAYIELTKRCEMIIHALQNCGVDAAILSSGQIAQLLYATFSQEEGNLLKLREAMESGMFRLYTSPNQ